MAEEDLVGTPSAKAESRLVVGGAAVESEVVGEVELVGEVSALAEEKARDSYFLRMNLSS